MKKLCTLACAMSLLLLSGCSDASADISDSSKVLFKVGDQEVSREDMYAPMKANAANTVIEEATKKIVAKEIETTDAMKEAATKSLEDAKKTTGDSFVEYINGLGYETEKEYYENYLLLQEQQKGLNQKYVSDNFDKIAKKVYPVKAQIIYITDETKANTALADIKAGKGFAETAQAYGDTTNFNGTVQLVHSTSTGMVDALMNKIKTIKKDNTLVDTLIRDASGNGFYIVNVVNVNPNDFKDEAITALQSIATTADDAMAYYLKKYNFTVYDIDVYKTLESKKPAYLVQK